MKQCNKFSYWNRAYNGRGVDTRSFSIVVKLNALYSIIGVKYLCRKRIGLYIASLLRNFFLR